MAHTPALSFCLLTATAVQWTLAVLVLFLTARARPLAQQVFAQALMGPLAAPMLEMAASGMARAFLQEALKQQ